MTSRPTSIATACLAALLAVAGAWSAEAEPRLKGVGIDWALDPEDLQATCRRATSAATERVREVVADAPRAAASMERLVAVETALADLDGDLVAHTLLADVTSDDRLRAASAACKQAVAELHQSTASDARILALARQAGERAGNVADRALAARYIESGEGSGAHLDAGTRAVLNELLDRLKALEIEFQQALAADRTHIEISREEADSLPADLRQRLTATEDGYQVPVDFSGTGRQFLSTMASADARRRFQVAFLRRGGEANLARVQEALGLRSRIAALAGFESWADYRLATRMAGTPDRAMRLAREVAAGLRTQAGREMVALSDLKRRSGDATPFAAWDYLYFKAVLERERYDVDQERIRDYLPVERVIPAVMSVYSDLFGVEFHRVETERPWAPGVAQYAILAPGADEPMAYAFFDLVPRAGKYLRPASFPLRPGRRLPDGGYERPVSAIIGNGPGGRPEQPARFSHRELVEFFHEFGHLVHTTLSTAPYASLYGANVRRDFVEMPSQMLENWTWDPDILARVSSHVRTSAPMPRELIDDLVATRYMDAGVFWTRQAFLAAYDLAVHGPEAEIDANALWFNLMPKLTPLPPTPGTMPPASFMPIMGGYDAGYYGYLWSRVYAQDLFEARFADDPLDADVGLEFRRQVLEPGGTVEPDELLERFLGRPVDDRAFLDALSKVGTE